MFLNDWIHYRMIKKSGFFDPVYYLASYPEVQNFHKDPLWHYVISGWKEGKDPSAKFSSTYYLEKNPDVNAAKIDPLLHYLKYGRREGRSIKTVAEASEILSKESFIPSQIPPKKNIPGAVYQLARNVFGRLPLSFQNRIRARLGNYLPVVRRLKETQQPTVDPYDNYKLPWRKEAMESFFACLGESTSASGPFKYLFFMPLFSTGGAELVALNFIRALVERDPASQALLVITDFNKVEIQYPLPPRLTVVNLEKLLQTSDWDRKKIFLYDIILTLRPELIHNINSSAFWMLLPERGRKLREVSRIFANIFCFQFDATGARIGYAEYYLRAGLPYLNGLISDNKRFVEDAIREYNLQSSQPKFIPIYTPFIESNKLAAAAARDRLVCLQNSADSHRRLKCLWAGRLDEQKRYKFFIEVVHLCDFCDFDMYGQAVMDTTPEIPNLPNLSFHGSFRSFEEIIAGKNYDAFVFTSQWEGIPTTLLGIGNWGIPIIAPAVGGVGEVVTAETGYLLSENPSPEEYRDALESIRANPSESSRRAANMLDLILTRHSWAHFQTDVENIPGYLDKARIAVEPNG